MNLLPGAKSFDVTHQYLDDNPTSTASDIYPVSLKVTDDDTGEGTGSTTLTVSNVAPALSNVQTTSPVIDEGQFAHLTGAISEPGILDPLTLTIDWGEGAPEIIAFAAGSASKTKAKARKR